MPTTITSSRFGEVVVPDEAVIEFPAGLIGLGGLRYTLIAREESTPFLWLHSLDDPSLALPVTEPRQFISNFELQLSQTDLGRIGVDDPAEADVYVTVRAAEALQDFRVNLRAPIVISQGRGFQVINEAPGSSVRAPLFAETALEQVA